MFRSGLLVLTSPLSHLHSKLPSILSGVQQYVKERLYVKISPGLLSTNILPTSALKHSLIGLYSQIDGLHTCFDVRILLDNINGEKDISKNETGRSIDTDISKQHQGSSHSTRSNRSQDYDVVLTDSSAVDVFRKFVKDTYPALPTDRIQFLNVEGVSTSPTQSSETSDLLRTYDNVVIGGTFDRLHTGHKILLTESCLLCQKSLTIGVTDGEMNKKKTLHELMQPLDVRISHLTEFLTDVKPSLRYNIVPITDPFGPSIVDPDLQCIVVSQETVRGGEAVNARRKERGLSHLDVDIIDLVLDAEHAQEEDDKVSSSSARNRQLGTLIRKPQPQKLVAQPFIIGLTGGIACGKSSVCRRLEELGAGVVDCDKLGHVAYTKGTSTLQALVDTFGQDILNKNSEIDRKVLGGKVFSDKSEMKKLNGIVWPAIADLAKKQVQDFYQQGKSVVILDAAVLLEAGWDEMCHEIWVSVIPKPEAVRRIVERNGLTEEQAMQRINAQMESQARVDRANVVLSTLWAPEVTQKQVEKAWKLLQERLDETVNT